MKSKVSKLDTILEVLLRVSTAKAYSTLPFTDVRKHLTPIAKEVNKALRDRKCSVIW